MLRFKHGPDDTEGVGAQLEGMDGKMVLKFDRPVDAIQMTLEDITAMIMSLVEAGGYLQAMTDRQSAPMDKNKIN